MITALLDEIARDICRENCAHYGEPPCWEDVDGTGEEWPNPRCDDPGCIALAQALEPRIRAALDRIPAAQPAPDAEVERATASLVADLHETGGKRFDAEARVRELEEALRGLLCMAQNESVLMRQDDWLITMDQARAALKEKEPDDA